MPYLNAHILLRVGGHFGASASPLDNWSVGLRFSNPGSDVPYDATALTNFNTAALAAFVTLHGAAGTYAGTTCFLDYSTSARVGTDGRYLPDTQDTIRNDRTPLPGLGSANLPWNTALVVSLRTSKPRGYASNGRMYYPCTSISVDGSTGRVSTGTVNSRLAVFNTLVQALNTAAQAYAPNMRLCVMSSVGGGATYKVTALRSDTRLDSIERRENAQPAAWSTVSVPQT